MFRSSEYEGLHADKYVVFSFLHTCTSAATSDLYLFKIITISNLIMMLHTYVFKLIHCRLSELPHTIYWKILISILGMSGYVIEIF